MKLRFLAVAVWSGLLLPNVASAQNYAGAIYDSMQGVADQECLRSKPDEAFFTGGEAELPAKAAMARYWAAVRQAEGVRIDELFQKNAKAAWVANGIETSARSGLVTDPYARTPGNVLVEQPVSLVRARRGETARGVWEVRDPSGAIVGRYLVDFRQSSDWRPQRVEVIPPDAPIPAVKPYCYMPGDIEAATAAISDSQVAKRAKKATAIATCMAGQDCAEKWARAKQWIMDNSVRPLIRNSGTLLLTSDPARASLAASYVVALDPPATDNRRAIRFRAWCGNWFMCIPKPGDAREAFAAALQAPLTEVSKLPM